MNNIKTTEFKFILENSHKEQKILQVSPEEHIELQPGDIIKVEQSDIFVSQLVPLFKEESLAIVYEDGSTIVLDHFFTKTGEGIPTPGININQGTYHAPDFIEGVSTNFNKNSLFNTKFTDHWQHNTPVALVSDIEDDNSTSTRTQENHFNNNHKGYSFQLLQSHNTATPNHSNHHISDHNDGHIKPISNNHPSPSHDPSHQPSPESSGDNATLPSHHMDPHANDLSISMFKSQIVKFNDPNQGLLHYDNIEQGSKIFVSGDSLTSLGVHITINQDGTFSYDPTELKNIYSLQEGQILDDKFNYTITDEQGHSSTATVYININGATDHIILGTNGNDSSLEGQGSGDLKGLFGNNVIIGDPGGVVFVQDHPVINVCLALDVSTRMNEPVNNYLTKLDLLKASVMELIDGYEKLAHKGAIFNIDVIPITDALGTQSLGTFHLTGDPHDDLHNLQELITSLETRGDAASYTAALQETQEWLHSINDYTNANNSVIFISEGTPTGEANPQFYFPDDLPKLQQNGEPMQFEFEMGKGTWSDIFQNADVHSVAVGEDSPISDLLLINNSEYSPTVIANIYDTGKLVNFVPDIPLYSPDVMYGGNDVIHGGFGTTLVFGDVPNTDSLSSPHFGGAGTHNGAGYAVLADKFNNNTADIVNYLMDPTDHYSNARALADANHGGNDTIYGGIGHNIIFSEGGDNLIYGGNAGDFIFTGNGNNIIHAGNGSNYINAGEGQNQIYGGQNNDTIVFHEGNLQLGTGIIDGGGGINTLLFSGHDQCLDLTAQHNPLYNFTHIDLNGDSNHSHNQICLGLQDVFDISADKHILFIEGNDSSQVNTQGNWNMVGTESINDHQYAHYAQDAVNLYVESNIQFQIQTQQQEVALIA